MQTGPALKLHVGFQGIVYCHPGESPYRLIQHVGHILVVLSGADLVQDAVDAVLIHRDALGQRFKDQELAAVADDQCGARQDALGGQEVEDGEACRVLRQGGEDGGCRLSAKGQGDRVTERPQNVDQTTQQRRWGMPYRRFPFCCQEISARSGPGYGGKAALDSPLIAHQRSHRRSWWQIVMMVTPDWRTTCSTR